MDLSAAPSISPPVYKAKYSRACTFCRKKKVRCEGGYPCKQCADHDEICAFTGRRRFVRKPRAAYETVSARLGRLEGLINLTSAPREDSHAGQAPSRDRDEALLFQDDSPSTQAQVSSENDVSVLANPGSEKASAPFSQLPQPHISLQRYERQMNAFASPNFQNDHWYVGRDVNDTHSSGFEPSLSDAMPATMTTVNAKVPSTIETQTDLAAPFPEEPGSQETSSLIADEMPAISWVESKVKMQGVRASILRFTEDITRRMKVGPESFLQSRTRAPEPTKDIAWLYTDATGSEAD
ncbi:hypothetical protein H2204_006509 [Knufia peltigerae]|uniref:Zn(2)-C6 fungal-type domain-containing protein n=1 Tax=Knufia peltigerae TaxID=1002370 RepID=A0AA39CXX3_9EURO|nr:hypothetical protein H2204_006509 [Knufia peltigerae]